MIDKQLKHEINELLYLALENTASVEQVARLDGLMKSSVEILQYVADYYFIAAALRKSNSIALASLGTQDEVGELHHLLDEMAKEERTAPSVEVAPVAPSPKVRIKVKEVPVVKAKRINPYSFAMTIASLAAFLALIAYVQIVPPKESVAVLNDSISAQWQGTQEDIESGFTFYNTDAPWFLKKGIIEIEFEYGAKVMIEGPSEFVCKSDNQITLTYGRLYARVPSKAIGFTVETENSRIVDLGTEFGVQVNVDGTTELHVLKGFTKLLVGEMTDEDTFSVAKGQAKEVSSDGDRVKEIYLKENSFVQQINSKTSLIRKGQKTVDLADIVSGGNGFGTGQRNVEINPVTGVLSERSKLDRSSDNMYHSVKANPFIDGVFVPNGEKTKQVVTSLGDVFSECPPTGGNFYVGLAMDIPTLDGRPIMLDDIDYGQSEHASIFMHANLGVTYDLDAIRSQLDDVHVSRFQSTIGVCDTTWLACNADFWVLVDGQVRYRKEHVQQSGAVDFLDIELHAQDRFLTLVATDGGDPEERLDGSKTIYSVHSDWCLFAKPVLLLE